MKLKAFLKKINFKSFIKITIGVMLSSLAFSFFLNINNIDIGGVSGLSVIFKKLYGWDAALSALIMNLALLVVGFIFLGREFLVKNAYASIMYPVFIKVFDLLYGFLNTKGFDLLVKENGGTTDYILVIIFSSLLMGVGLGMVLKEGSSTGGTETPQNILYKYFHIPYSISLYVIDGTVILLGFFLLKQEANDLFYEIIFMVISGVLMDAIVFSGFNKRAVYIISAKQDEIRDKLINDFERGVTSIKVVGEFTHDEKKLLLCVMSSKEYMKLRAILEEVDPHAFYYSTRANEVRGEGFSYGENDWNPQNKKR